MRKYKRIPPILKRRRHLSGPSKIKLERGAAALLKQKRLFVHKNPYTPGAFGSHAANADNVKNVPPGPGFNPPRQGWFHQRQSMPTRRRAPKYTRRRRRRTKRRALPRPITRRRKKRAVFHHRIRSPPKTLVQRFMSAIGLAGGYKSRRRRTQKRL